MSSKSPGKVKRPPGDEDYTSPEHVTEMLLLCCHGMYIFGIISIIIAVGIGTTGIMNVIVQGFLANAATGIWSGVLTLINGYIVLKNSQNAIVTAKSLKLMFITTCVTVSSHVATLTVACIAIFNEFHYLGNQLKYACDRDPNQCSTAVGDPNYNGNNLNPNYNPNCDPKDPYCNIGPAGELNYSPSCWHDKMQAEILRLYSYYRYTYRYSFGCETLQILFCGEMIALETILLVLLGYMMMQISDKDSDSEMGSMAPSLVGLSKPLPGSAPIVMSDGDGLEQLYVNLPPRLFSPVTSMDALAVAAAAQSSSKSSLSHAALDRTFTHPSSRQQSLNSILSQTAKPNVPTKT